MNTKTQKIIRFGLLPFLSTLYLLGLLSSVLGQEATPTIIVNTGLDIDFIVMVILLALNLILIFYPKIPMLNFAVGAISILISVQCFGNAIIPFQPYFSMLLLLVSIMSLISAVISLQGD